MNENAPDATIDQHSPRRGVIELLQVLSLLTFACAAWLYSDGAHKGTVYLTVGIALLLGGLPFLPYFLEQTEQPRPRKRPVKRMGGLEITRNDLNSLHTLGVPEDMLSGIEESIVGIWYVSDKDLRLALERKFGEERIEKWFTMIRNYAWDQNRPSEPTRDEEGPRQPSQVSMIPNKGAEAN